MDKMGTDSMDVPAVCTERVRETERSKLVKTSSINAEKKRGKKSVSPCNKLEEGL